MQSPWWKENSCRELYLCQASSTSQSTRCRESHENDGIPHPAQAWQDWERRFYVIMGDCHPKDICDRYIYYMQSI